MKNRKLELTWIGKDKREKVEPRILIEDPELSNLTHDKETENILIHGDNLLALKALEQEYTGKVKCIYIDPPYNTGSAFEHYDDNLEHSIWLSLMRERLVILQKLLREDGYIFIQIDDNEQAYLRVIMDEIFGRQNFVNTISVNMKNIAGASGGGEDKRLKKNIEYIHVYSKNYNEIKPFNNVYDYTEISELVEWYKRNNVSWKYTQVMLDPGEKEYVGTALDGDGKDINIYRRTNYNIKSIGAIAREEGITEKEVYYKYSTKVMRTTMPQSSIRPRVMERMKELNLENDFLSIEYVPKTGRNKDTLYEQFYRGDKYNLVAWLKDVMDEIDGKLYKKDLQGTYWDFTAGTKNLTKEGKVSFPNGKKPESLIKRILELCTEEGDLVLDSFLGSGTTSAVAHKMKRNWIGIEMAEQAYTHCKVRLDSIISGKDNSGITTDVNWKKGGGYKFYELAPTLIKTDKFGQEIINDQYNAEMLASAVAMHEGYTYSPDEDLYWKQSTNNSGSYLFVTTRHVDKNVIDSIKTELKEDEFLVIVCKSYNSDIVVNEKNITIKKIPQSLLKNCEFEVEDYKLNIISPPVYDYEEDYYD